MPLTRRDLLGAALLARCGVAPSLRQAQLTTQEKPLDQQLFPLGVMAGDATHEACVLWTHYKGQQPLCVRVWSDNELLAYEAEVPVRDGFALVDVGGLRPLTAYRYAFSDADARSMVGNFKTLPALDATEPLVFAGASCTHPRRAPFPVLSRAALRNDVSFFIHGGDHVYTDGAQTVEDYRAAYAGTYKQTGMLALHQAFTFYGVWDDHDIDEAWNPEESDRDKVARAMQVYFEHTPLRSRRLWRSFRWGSTAEIFVLDCRSERRPSTRKTQDAQYISPEQLAWLKQGLVSSPCPFKFIVNSVPIANFGGLYDFKASDRWEGYAAQREDLLSFIVGEQVRGCYFLSGDFHCAFAGRLEKDGPYSALREITWGPGGNRMNPLYTLLNAPQWDFATGENNVLVLSPDVGADTLHLEWVNAAGDVVGRVDYANG